MNSKEMKLNLGNTYMNVIQFGHGPKNLVMISGVTLSGLEGQGEGVAAAFKDYLDEFTFYLFERRKVLEEGASIQDMAEDVATCMDQLGVEKAYVYGASQGGMIGQVLALTHPEKVIKLCICSTLSRPSETVKKTAAEWLTLAKDRNVVGLNRSFFKYVYSKAFLDSVKDMIPVLEKVGTAKDCDRFVILVEAILKFDVYQDLKNIQCPVFAVADTNDHVLGVEPTLEIADALNCEKYIYTQYSHAVYDEAADFKEKMCAFFKK
ncbi:MAG: alpha/beta hydrolase [Firmicutes bacterium]|nr:alpha/beta hydrolase [Bacillota bacterium]